MVNDPFPAMVFVLLLSQHQGRSCGGAARIVSKPSRKFREFDAVGSQALQVFGQKAQNGAKMLYEFLSSGSQHDGPTGSTPKPGRDTLTAEDREIPWLAPRKAAGPATASRREG